MTSVDFVKGDFDLGLNIYSPDTMDNIIKGGVTNRQSCCINHQWETPATYNDDPMCDSKTILRKLGGMEVLEKQE